MSKWLLIGVLALTAIGCTDEHGARRVLEAEGYTQITMTGYDFLGCGKDDNFATGFAATNVNQKRVTGVVCSGLLKGYTIRFH